jgi:hypothetical protein
MVLPYLNSNKWGISSIISTGQSMKTFLKENLNINYLKLRGRLGKIREIKNVLIHNKRLIQELVNSYDLGCAYSGTNMALFI